MVGIFFQELKDRSKNLICYVLLLFCAEAAVFLVMRQFPKLITESMMGINRSKLLMAFLELQEFITAVTYEQMTMVLLTAVGPLMMYFVLKECAAAYWREERMGTMQYYYSLGITRIAYWSGKFLAGLFCYFLYFGLMYGMVLLLSQYGIPVKILKEISLDRVNRIMGAMFSIGLLCLGAGNILGVCAFEYRGKKWMRCVFAGMAGVCLLPNILSAVIYLFETGGFPAGIWKGIAGVVSAVRKYVPMHWCSPWNSVSFDKAQISGLLLGSMILCTVAAGVSAWIYHRKNLMVR